MDRRIGDSLVECVGEQGPTVLIYAEEGDAKILGVHALEALRLELDPSTSELKRSEASLAI